MTIENYDKRKYFFKMNYRFLIFICIFDKTTHQLITKPL
jgi:hypothetical protein